MKLSTTMGGIMAGLLFTGLTIEVIAQNSPGAGPKGRGYGGPPQSQAERDACHEACPKGNGTCPTICPNGGPGGGRGQANGAGNAHRRGLRNGTGPRGGGGHCPMSVPDTSSAK